MRDETTTAPVPGGVLSVRTLWPVGLLTAAILACWLFPYVWYTHGNSARNYFWLAEQTRVPDWSYAEEPVGKTAESMLVADRLVNGEFTNRVGGVIRVFSAKRFQEKQNEVGLFVHTPDRCWTQAGWHIEPALPDVLTVNLHGVPLRVERRIFVGNAENQRELVYFCGLTGGEPLPYRLDHNLSVAMKYQLRQSADKTGSTARASDSRLWTRVWEAFRSRKALLGPKQFFRISTPVSAANPQAGDQLLQKFLGEWLTPSDFTGELQAWKNAPASVVKKS